MDSVQMIPRLMRSVLFQSDALFFSCDYLKVVLKTYLGILNINDGQNWKYIYVITKHGNVYSQYESSLHSPLQDIWLFRIYYRRFYTW